MKNWWVPACLLTMLLTACADNQKQQPVSEEDSKIEQERDEEAAAEEVQAEKEVSAEAEYYTLENPPRELTEMEEMLMRKSGPFHGGSFNAASVTAELGESYNTSSVDDWYEAILDLIHESYYEDVERVIKFDPTIEVESEDPEEQNPEEEDLPGSSHFSILLDVSGSMAAENESGSRMEEAKEAIGDFVEALPDNSTMSLRIYGQEGSNAEDDKEISCEVTEAVYEGDADTELVRETLKRVEPTGWTPLALAIEDAADDIPENVSDAIVYIVSDGMETCGGDPAAAAEELVDQEIEPIINIIGFQVEAEEQKMLMDIAEAGHGDFSYVDSKQELEEYWREEYERMMDAWNAWKQDAMEEVDRQSEELMNEAEEIGESIMEKSDTEFDHAEEVLDTLHSQELIDYDTKSDLWSNFYNRSKDIWSYGYDAKTENWSAAYNAGNERWSEVYNQGNAKWSEYYKKQYE
ncbi:VWA domain-containing protein [Alteribacillus sp. HJP-4]|uniref:vWA domain-containing protein n=1 Tax=Alteribacillus sp. HJP-4 TaxID=2775394 RepID=UPI0035CCFD15